MQRIILIFITLFISSMSFAYEEICLAGDTVTFKFGSNQLPENLSLPSTEFDSSLSACNKAVSIYDALLDSNGQKYFYKVLQLVLLIVIFLFRWGGIQLILLFHIAHYVMLR